MTDNSLFLKFAVRFRLILKWSGPKNTTISNNRTTRVQDDRFVWGVAVLSVSGFALLFLFCSTIFIPMSIMCDSHLFAWKFLFYQLPVCHLLSIFASISWCCRFKLRPKSDTKIWSWFLCNFFPYCHVSNLLSRLCYTRNMFCKVLSQSSGHGSKIFDICHLDSPADHMLTFLRPMHKSHSSYLLFIYILFFLSWVFSTIYFLCFLRMKMHICADIPL